MLVYSPKLTAGASIVAVLMTLSTLVFLPTLRAKVRNVLVLDAENQGILVETFKGAIAVKTTSAAPQFWQELQTRFGHLANLSLETMKIVIVNNTFF